MTEVHEPHFPLFPQLGENLTYLLHRSRRRTVSVEVHPRGEIIVRSPMRLPIQEIENFLRSRSDWISARLAETKRARSAVPILPSNNHFHHRGNVELWDGKVGGWQRWQRKQAEIVFEELISELLPVLSVSAVRYKALRLRKMSRRWGQCSSDGTITLNVHLIKVPDVAIKAVVAHELAHLVHMNHSKKFYHLVDEIYPEHAVGNELLDLWTSVLPSVATKKNGGTGGSAEERSLWLQR